MELRKILMLRSDPERSEGSRLEARAMAIQRLLNLFTGFGRNDEGRGRHPLHFTVAYERTHEERQTPGFT